MKKALIVVDVQNDFCEGGSLAVPQGNEVIPVINNMFPEFDLVIFTLDYHTDDMDAFYTKYKNKKQFDVYTNAQGVEDVLWTPHCVANTFGAEIHKDIDYTKIKGDFYFFKKGVVKDFHPYSGFGAEGLLEFLQERGVTDTYVTGLATDYCVKDTALDSVKNGFNTFVVQDATRGIADDMSITIDTFHDNGINVIDYDYFIQNK